MRSRSVVTEPIPRPWVRRPPRLKTTTRVPTSATASRASPALAGQQRDHVRVEAEIVDGRPTGSAAGRRARGWPARRRSSWSPGGRCRRHHALPDRVQQRLSVVGEVGDLRGPRPRVRRLHDRETTHAPARPSRAPIPRNSPRSGRRGQLLPDRRIGLLRCHDRQQRRSPPSSDADRRVRGHRPLAVATRCHRTSPAPQRVALAEVGPLPDPARIGRARHDARRRQTMDVSRARQSEPAIDLRRQRARRVVGFDALRPGLVRAGCARRRGWRRTPPPTASGRPARGELRGRLPDAEHRRPTPAGPRSRPTGAAGTARRASSSPRRHKGLATTTTTTSFASARVTAATECRHARTERR